MSITYVIRAFGGIVPIDTNSLPPPPLPTSGGTFVMSVSGVSYSVISTLFMVNGTILDTQPTIITAPVTMGPLLETGSSFILIFNSPSTNTQNLLANGSTISLSFVLANGRPVTAQVRILSTLFGGTSFQVICTLLQTLSLSPSFP